MLYRVDHKAANIPSVSTIAIDATDYRVARSESYHLNIRHCRTWNPSYGEQRGFMPHVEYRSEFIGREEGQHFCAGDMWNGEVFHGTDQEAYDKAVRRGIEMLNIKQKELDDRMAEMRKQYEAHCRQV